MSDVTRVRIFGGGMDEDDVVFVQRQGALDGRWLGEPQALNNQSGGISIDASLAVDVVVRKDYPACQLSIGKALERIQNTQEFMVNEWLQQGTGLIWWGPDPRNGRENLWFRCHQDGIDDYETFNPTGRDWAGKYRILPGDEVRERVGDTEWRATDLLTPRQYATVFETTAVGTAG